MWLQYGTLTVMVTIGLPDVRALEMERPDQKTAYIVS
jgi:hypothetical protein